MTRAWSCDEAVARLLEPVGEAPPELAAHLEGCAECRLLARDVGALQALVAEARADIDAHSPHPDVLARTAPEARQPLRLVHGGAAGPALPASRAGGTRRAIPLALAIAAGLVAVTATAVFLREDAPRPRPVEQVVLRDTGESPPAPRRPAEPMPTPAISIAPAEPTPPPTQQLTGEVQQKRDTPPDSPLQHRVSPNAPVPRTPSSAPTPPTAPAGPAPELLAQRTLRSQMPRLQSCYERALRRDLRLGDATADLTVDIAPEGGVQSVSVSGDATPELRRCLEQTVRNAQFPTSESGLRVSVPLRFEVVRERMGTNVRPRGTVSE